MNLKRFKTFAFLCLVSVAVLSCNDEDGPKKGGGGLNFFSIQDDKELGAQVAAEIESNPSEYPILDSASYATAYQILYQMRDRILNSGEVVYKDEFAWRLRIIHDDDILNAFCTPGGYIYIYTGLIKFLESEDELAGVLGHEIAHADERHSTSAMTKQYGLDVLFSIVLGDNSEGLIAEIGKNLINLSYSRDNESESDLRSVEYLYPTDYDARGAARFFEALIDNGQGGGPQFLSTHPSPENRVENIIAHWEKQGGEEGERFIPRYNQLIASLP